MSTRLTDDQRTIMRTLAKGDTYEGALAMFTGLDDARVHAVLRQLRQRGFVRRKPGQPQTWQMIED